MPKFEATGHWWIVDTPHRRVPGTLKVRKDGSAQLRLEGHLQPDEAQGEERVVDGVVSIVVNEETLDKTGNYPRIVGEAEGTWFTGSSQLRV